MSPKLSYPVLESRQKQLVLASVIGLWLFLFLFFAEPFKIDKFSFTKKITVLPIYGLIQASIIYAVLIYQNWVLKKGREWSLINELVYLLIVTLLAWVVNYSYYILFVTSGENTYSFIDHAKYHFLPALLIVLPVLMIVRFVAGSLGKFSNVKEESIIFKGTGLQDFLKLDANELLYVAAEGNYINVYYRDSAIIKNQLIRAKMSSLSSVPHLLQVHRSFYVNPKSIRRYYYKNKNLIVVLTNDFEIQVARSKKKELMDFLTN